MKENIRSHLDDIGHDSRFGGDIIHIQQTATLLNDPVNTIFPIFIKNLFFFSIDLNIFFFKFMFLSMFSFKLSKGSYLLAKLSIN